MQAQIEKLQSDLKGDFDAPKELKPCPFCGSEVFASWQAFGHEITGKNHSPQCFLWRTEGKLVYGDKNRMIDEWNTRIKG